MIDGSRLASVQTVHGFCVSILPQVLQTSIFSIAVSSAEVSGAISSSRFLMRWSAARRAERGPKPGSRASSWIRRSISGPATAAGMSVLLVIAGLDPAIHHLRKKMDARVKPGHDGIIHDGAHQNGFSPGG